MSKQSLAAKAYSLGYSDGLDWIGPYGDGSYGCLSIEFLSENFRRDYPDLKRYVYEYLVGHRDGVCDQ